MPTNIFLHRDKKNTERPNAKSDLISVCVCVCAAVHVLSPNYKSTDAFDANRYDATVQVVPLISHYIIEMQISICWLCGNFVRFHPTFRKLMKLHPGIYTEHLHTSGVLLMAEKNARQR